MAEVIDLIQYANENKPVEFQHTFKDLLQQKAMNALAQKEQEIAQSMFNEPQAEDEINIDTEDSDVAIETPLENETDIEAQPEQEIEQETGDPE